MYDRESRLRPRAVIETARVAALAWMPLAEHPGFEQGAIAAYDWLLGRTDQAPASGVVTAPTAQRVLREEQAANDATVRRRNAPDLPYRYSIGVANALMWARGVPGVEPPVPLDYPVAE
jgi:hypothetical protein